MLHTISLLQCLSTDFVLLSVIYKISFYGQCQESHPKCTKKRDFQQSGREIWIPKKENMMIQKIKDRQLKKDITIKKN